MLKQLWLDVTAYLKKADLLLLGLALVTSCFGLVLIYSTTLSYGTYHYVFIHCIAIMLGVGGYIVASLADLRRFPRLWVVLFIFNILFQLSLYFFGTAGDTGNKSWINYDWMPMAIQPGEIGKIIFIYTFASHINVLREKLNHPLSVLQLFMHFALTVGSVFIISRDLGVSIIYVFIFLIMLYASGINLLWFFGTLLGACACAPVLWHFMDEYQRLRIIVVWNPEASAKYAWHAEQSMLALGNGGLFGAGLGRGSQVQNSILFSKHADFIFASCGEELGFVGCAVLLALLTAMVVRCFTDSSKPDNLMGYLMCIGVGAMMMFQILINVGMCLGIMPVIGLTLPFVSYGGSSILTFFVSIGFVCGATMNQTPKRLRR